MSSLLPPVGFATAVLRSALLLGLVGGCLCAQSPNPSPFEKQAQTPVEGSQTAAPGSVATGGAHAAVLDAQHRPITAGGFVSSGPVVFNDITAESGLSAWTHHMGPTQHPGKAYILETVGSGVALLDYDNDGWLDIYLVNGADADQMHGKGAMPHAALFHNNHDGDVYECDRESRRGE